MARCFFLLLILGCTSTPPDSANDAGAMCTPSGLRPGARYAHQAVAGNGKLWVYGGDSAPFNPNGMTPSVYVDELWSYDLGCQSWSRSTGLGAPGRRGLYAATLDEKRQRILLVGGRKNDHGYELLNDLWSFDLIAQKWTQLGPSGSPPKKRQSHRVVYDPTGDRLLLFGGNGATLFGGNVLGDTWELSFASGGDGAWQELKPAQHPSARQDVGTAFDASRGLWLVFGGAFDFSNYSDEVWAFELSKNEWHLVDMSGGRPTKRFWATLVRDEPRDRILLFGGHDDGPIGLVNDSWSLALSSDGKTGSWQNLIGGDSELSIAGVDPLSPERRNKQSFVALGSEVWLFGGITDCGPINDVWTFDLAANHWTRRWPAELGETCARRATEKQTCPSDCGNPL